MVSKKLLIPLYLALLLAPIVSVRESSDPDTFPAYEDGIFIDGPFPEELYVPPTSNPNITLVPGAATTAVATSSAEEASIQINILLAMDEEYLMYHYPAPSYPINGLFYARLQISRASHYFEQVFDVGLVVVDTVTWHRDESGGIDALYEVIEETGFEEGMFFNGHKVEALLAWTCERLPYPPLGEAYGICHPDLSAVIVRYVSYWTDDNTVGHEMGHLCGVDVDGLYAEGSIDCYYSDCVMSYRKEYVGIHEEDGAEWELYRLVRVAFLYNTWCEVCFEKINYYHNATHAGKWRYLAGPNFCPGDGDC